MAKRAESLNPRIVLRLFALAVMIPCLAWAAHVSAFDFGGAEVEHCRSVLAAVARSVESAGVGNAAFGKIKGGITPSSWSEEPTSTIPTCLTEPSFGGRPLMRPLGILEASRLGQTSDVGRAKVQETHRNSILFF